MTEIEKKDEDVEEVVTPDKKSKADEDDDDIDDDKQKNLANLRKKSEALEKENAELKKQLESKGSDNRTLGEEDDDEEDKDKGKEKKIEKKSDSDPLEIVFKRDLKEATRTWNKKNKVTDEEWGEVKKRVSLKGDETQSEIFEKIDEAYSNLPSTRKKREKEIFDKGKKAAMSEHTDDELDFGGGGADVDLEGSGGATQLNSKSKKWGKGLGLTDKELKEVDMEEDPNAWKPGKQATRKFFTP